MRAREAGWTSKRILEAVRNGNLQMQMEEAYTPEMQEIKQKAIADGTFMKAPNGKPTNLTERQWLQVRTKNFKKWFGDWEKKCIFANVINDRYNGKENAKRLSLQRVDLATLAKIEEDLRRAITSYEGRSSGTGQGNEGSRRETNEQKQTRLESWAKENNLWVDNLSDTLEYNFGEPFESGGEAVVYLADDGETVVKAISLDYYGGDPQLALDRVLLHNYLFSNTSLTNIGFGRDSDGTFKIFVEQPYVKGTPASRKEILQYAKNRGFRTVDGNTFYFNGIKINDLNELNVIKSPNGDFAVIDAELRFITQEEINTVDRNVSKVVDKNGEPKVMFHQTANQFTVFDTSRSEASSVDTATPFGIFLKPTSQNIGVRGDIQMPLFVSMKNPLRASDRAKLEKTIRKNSKEYARLQDEYSQKDEELFKRKNQARQEGDFELASQLRKESNKLEEEYSTKLKKEINKFLNDKKYDGIILEQDEGTSGETVSATIALDANQVKSATDNSGEFSQDNDDIQFMLSSDGKVRIFGFAKGGKFWADLNEANPNSFLHENTHLWDRVVAKNDPRLWRRGVQIMKSKSLKAPGSDISIWEWVEQSRFYGMSDKWQKLKNSDNKEDRDRYEFLVASEVHARLVGQEGQEILMQLAETRGAKGIVAKFRQWLKDFYKALLKMLPSTFHNWTDEELDRLTVEDFLNMTLRDIMEGAHRADFSQTQTAAQMSQETSSETYTPEMITIKQAAEDNGTFMKAPNGRPSNLNERQWLQVRTKAFKNWFGDWINDPSNASKIVDENGEPLVVYHNTDNNFTKFSKFRSLIGKLTGSALFGRGFYFSNYQGSSHRINMPVFLSVKNPAEGVMESGNDGMIQDFGNGQVWYAAKKPNQIKSATDNIGTFSRENDDIQMMVEESNNADITSFENIDNAIQTGNWSEKAVNDLNNLINDIENGKKTYTRFLLGNQQDGYRRGHEVYEAASVILGRIQRANEDKSRNQKTERGKSEQEKRARREREGKEQEKILETWAKANDLWINDYEDPEGKKANSLEELLESQWPLVGIGSESHVYYYDENTVLKTINLSHYDNNLQRTLDKIALHNSLSPETSLEVMGFGRDSLGHFQIIVLQPKIQGQELTNEEFERFIEKLEVKEKDGWYYKDNLKITDLAPYNILKYKDEKTGEYAYALVDADFWINAEDENIDNSIVPADNTTIMKNQNRQTIEDDDFEFMAEENTLQPAQKPLTPKAQTVKRLLRWRAWQKQHIAFDEKTHTYYLDGKPVDYSVTQYQEEVYGKPNIRGDYKFAQQMGNAVDKLTRDFFNYIFNKGESPLNKNYQNLSETKKMEIIGHLKRLREQFDKEFTNPATGKPSTREALFFAASPLVFVTIIGT